MNDLDCRREAAVFRRAARVRRGITRNNTWHDGAPGPVTWLTGWCTRPLWAPAWLADRTLAFWECRTWAKREGER